MIEFIAETGSTNADLLQRLRRGERAPEGDWLMAARQTQGRGRQGRSWYDGYGNFMGSTVVEPGEGNPPAHTLAFVASLALYEAVLPWLTGPGALMLKWPNDLLLDGGKLSGILLERENDAVVIGIGVNLAVAPSLPDRATIALADVTDAPAPDVFAGALADRFSEELERWRIYGFEPIRGRWMAAAHPAGTALSVHDGTATPLAGAFAGLSPDGSLLLRLEDGTTRAIHAGDVMLA